MKRYPMTEQGLTNGLYNILRRTLSSQHGESEVRSLSEDVIVPAMAVAQKVCPLQLFFGLEI